MNPPVPFLPRKTKKELLLDSTLIPEGTNVILAVGGATRDGIDHPDDFKEDRKERDPLIFGGPEGTSAFLHQCVGQHLAMPVIARIVRGVLMLDGLTKHSIRGPGSCFVWKSSGGQLQEVPTRVQSHGCPDAVSSDRDHEGQDTGVEACQGAEGNHQVWRAEDREKVRDAGHVHFAWFLFLENDTKLMMATIYDRDFDSYIEFFALEIGPMFDLVFQHIEDPLRCRSRSFRRSSWTPYGANNRMPAAIFSARTRRRVFR